MGSLGSVAVWRRPYEEFPTTKRGEMMACVPEGRRWTFPLLYFWEIRDNVGDVTAGPRA